MNGPAPPAAQDERECGDGSRPFVLSDFAFELVRQDGIVALSRGRHALSGETILLAHAASRQSEGDAERQLNNEFALRDVLDEAWALKPIARVRRHAGVALVYPDLAAAPLSQLFSQGQHIDRFLALAIGMAEVLRQMHETGLIHKAIAPSNVLIDDAGRCRLAGFGLATRSKCDLPEELRAMAIESLPYMSPEHTGRTRHPIDARSDLYSLGVTLYQFLTGRLPFEAGKSADVHEWVHFHVAGEPVAPHLIVASVPEALSMLVLKLLAHSPERRYQTAAGLAADLKRCRAAWTTLGCIGAFDLGAHDRPSELVMPERLYAREASRKMLLAAFEHVRHHTTPALAVVRGPSGIGKSALLEAFLAGLQPGQSWQAAGKADQYRHDIPYAVLAEAFQQMVLEILGQPDPAVHYWQQRLVQALGPYGRLATDVIPALELLTGSLPPVAALTGPEAEERFRTVIHNLVAAFATSERPLVLLVDDLQWLDPASVNLLAYLIGSPGPLPLLLVVASREQAADKEAAEDALATLRGKAARVFESALDMLDLDAVEQLVADTLGARRRKLHDLVVLIHGKTHGNPFFVRQFLKAMEDDRLIVRHAEDGMWHYDLEGIRRHDHTENVADMVLQRLGRLPERTRTILGGMACLGRYADLATLGALYSLDATQLQTLLAPATEAEALRLDGERYAFSHDRVQEAAYALLGLIERKQLHLAAARLLAESALAGDKDETLFRAADHYAPAIDIVADPGERLRLARLGLLAAQRAKRAIAYGSAMRYLATALAAANEAPRDLLFSLVYEQAECEFLAGDLGSALSRVNHLLAMPASPIPMAQTHRLKVEIHTRLSENSLAVDTALAGLKAFGIHLAPHPAAADCEAAYLEIKARLADGRLDALLDLPPMADPEIEATMALLSALSVPASFTDGNLQFLQLCHMLRLTLDYGMTGMSTNALAWFGVLVCDRYAQYADGFLYGRIAHELVSRHQYLSYEARTLLPLDQLSVWTQPLSFSIDCVKAGFAAGVANGDFTTACFECCHQVWNLLVKGESLDAVAAEIERGIAFVSRTGFRDVEDILRVQHQFVEALRCQEFPAPTHGKGAQVPLDIEHDSFHERMSTLVFWYWLYEAMTKYLACDFIAARACIERASTLTWSAPGHLSLLDYHLFSALTLAAVEVPDEQRTAQRQRLLDHGSKINGWAAANPATFADKALLVEAEIARFDGNVFAAIALYEKAAWNAEEQGFLQYGALAHELAARLCSDHGLPTARNAHLSAARDAYLRWGARGKAAQLETLFPELAAAKQHHTYTPAGNEQLRDVESVIRSARALTEEIKLDRLIETLMIIALEHAAAQRGLLILLHGKAPMIEACARTTPSGIHVELGRRAPTAEDLPCSMLNTVIRTGQRIVIGKTHGPNPFASDEYFQRQARWPALCIPMLKQTELVGVLYLENRLMSEGFTVEHTKVLELLAAQAAVSIETARLYTDLVNENLQRRQVERALRASEASLAMGERVSHTGSWRWDLRQDVLICSEEFCRIFDFDTAVRAVPFSDFVARIHPDDRDMVMDAVRTGVAAEQSIRVEYRIVKSDGTIRHLAGIGTPLISEGSALEYVGTATDITTRRQAEDALRVAQADLARVTRATTVGQLTASIAHEINQPLMSIVANAGASLRWLDREIPEMERARDGLIAIASEGRRAGEMIQSLQALTRNSPPVFAALDMHDAIRHILAIARSELERRRISLQLALNAGCFIVLGDGVQIQQVLLNLVINAVEAMSEVADRPRILAISSAVTEPGYLQVSVEDTGTGLSEDAARHAFDPFYTTKKNGMGMGLAICQSIVAAHKGRLSVNARQPHGSVFAFIIPLAQAEG
jgi:predicted ATPase/signal transduction histidine kinase